MPTRDENRRVWGEEWNWSNLGEEWTPEWSPYKAVILRYTLDRWLRPKQRIVEIGPGGGRYTVELLKHDPASLTLVDLVEKTLDVCKERFRDYGQVQYFVNDGRTLPFLADGSVDFVWSFECFVHVEKDDVDSYFREFRRVLTPGGMGIVHYAAIDRAVREDRREGWRSDFTSADMRGILVKYDFELVEDHYDPTMLHGNSAVAVFRPRGTSAT